MSSQTSPRTMTLDNEDSFLPRIHTKLKLAFQTTDDDMGDDSSFDNSSNNNNNNNSNNNNISGNNSNNSFLLFEESGVTHRIGSLEETLLKNNKVVHQLLRRTRKLETYGFDGVTPAQPTEAQSPVTLQALIEMQNNLNTAFERISKLESSQENMDKQFQEKVNQVNAKCKTLEGQMNNHVKELTKNFNSQIEQVQARTEARINKLESDVLASMREALKNQEVMINTLKDKTKINQDEIEKAKKEYTVLTNKLDEKLKKLVDSVATNKTQTEEKFSSHNERIVGLGTVFDGHKTELKQRTDHFDEHLIAFKLEMKRQNDYSASMEQQVMFIDRQLQQIAESVTDLRNQRDFVQSMEEKLIPLVSNVEELRKDRDLNKDFVKSLEVRLELQKAQILDAETALHNMKDHGEQLRLLKGKTANLSNDVETFMDTFSVTRMEATLEALKKLQGDVVVVSGKVENLLNIQHEIDVIINASKERSLLKEIDLHIAHKLPEYLQSMAATGTSAKMGFASFGRLPTNTADLTQIETKFQARIDEIDSSTHKILSKMMAEIRSLRQESVDMKQKVEEANVAKSTVESERVKTLEAKVAILMDVMNKNSTTSS